MIPKSFHRSILLSFLFIVLPGISLPLQGNSIKSPDLPEVVTGDSDTAKIDLLLGLSEELLKSDPQQAFQYAGNAYELSINLGDAFRIGRSCLALGDFYHATAVYNKALQYNLMAIDQFREVADTLMMAMAYEKAGVVYMASGDFHQADFHYRKSLAMNKASKGHVQIAGNYMNMGLNMLQSDSVDKGLSYFLVSLLIADSLNMESEKVILMKNIGYAYARMGRHEEALAHFYKVLELLGDAPDALTRSDAQVNIARGYLEMKNYPAALKYARQAFATSSKGQYNRISRDAAEILSEIYAQSGEYRLAYDYVKIYRDLSDSILNAERAEQLVKIRTLYEVNEKEEENTYLRGQVMRSSRQMKTRTQVILVITILVLVLATLLYLLNRMNVRQVALNRKLATQSKELELLNDLKDKFFSFVAHNLKNPFNTIMGFSELMSRAADAKDINKAREYSGLIHNLSVQVQKVLSNLLDWSRLQRRTFEVKPEMVDLAGLIKDVVEMNTREAARKDINLDISSEGNIFVVADRTMITTVLQNLVANAIHFTSQSGKITIQCVAGEQHTEVTIADTGVGIPADKLKNLFNFDFSQAKMGAADGRGTGLGLILCQEMLHKNGGTIRAESEEGKGSRFIFTLPVAIRHDTTKDTLDVSSEGTPERVAEELMKSDFPISPGLRETMDLDIIPSYRQLTRILSIEDLQRFSKKLITAGEKYNHTALEAYGHSLQTLTQGHQVDIIIRILPMFGKFLENH